jgi:putative membrane protein
LSSPEPKRWRRTSPLAAIFYLGRIFEAIAKNAVQSLAPLVAFLVAFEGNLATRVFLGLAAFFTITIISSVVRYWFFRYRITNDSVLIRDGVFKKTQLDIKFDRIQAINTQQNVIYRYFDLVTVKFDTAGSAKQEGSLPAVRSELADSLKDRIRRVRPVAANGEEATETEATAVRPILSLTKMDMVRIGLSSNRALIFLVLLGPVMEQMEQRIGQAIEGTNIEAAIEGARMSLLAGFGLAVAVVTVFLLFLVIASVIGAILRYHNFTLVADDDVLRSTGGLLTRHEHAINLAKIQTLEARQNPMLRLFRRFRLRAKQASSGRPGRGKHFIIPLCTPDELQGLDREIFRDEFPDVEMRPRSAVFRPISVRYVRSRVLLAGVLPALLYTGPFVAMTGLAGLLALLWIPLCTLGVWIMYRKRGYFLSEHGLVLRRGFIGYRTNAFLHRKVQRISITQTLLQERKGLATIRFYLASGSLKLPYIEHDMARKLRDYILYRVESSRLAWH